MTLTKLILGAIVVVAPIIYFVLKRWASTTAEKDRLLKKIRELEDEMSKHRVGSYHYIRIRNKWLRLNKRWGDLAGRS